MFGTTCLCEVHLRRFCTENWISEPPYLLLLQEAVETDLVLTETVQEWTALEAEETALEAAETALEAAED